MPTFWDTLDPPCQAALEEAWTAYRAGSLPIGAVVTDSAGRILTRSRNRRFETSGPPGQLFGHRLAHAEVNAYLALDHVQVDPRTCTLYTTLEPCPLCIGAIRMGAIGELRYAARDATSGSVELLAATPAMRYWPVRVIEPQDSTLETAIVAMMVEATLRRIANPEVKQWLLDAWETALPAAVTLGRSLFASGELLRLSDEDTPAPVVIDLLTY
jgi:tRNA(Arg) A34 adenosine deaminase TadA